MTDIPLDARQLVRVARRVGLGLARVGSTANHGSGEIFCAVSTTNRQPRDATGVVDTRVLSDGSINDVFAATVDATEEAACNVLFVADTVVGRDGHTAPGLPVERVLELLGALTDPRVSRRPRVSCGKALRVTLRSAQTLGWETVSDSRSCGSARAGTAGGSTGRRRPCRRCRSASSRRTAAHPGHAPVVAPAGRLTYTTPASMRARKRSISASSPANSPAVSP